MDDDMIFFFSFLQLFPFHFRISGKNSAPRLLRVFLRPPTKFRQYLANFSVIPCELFSNTLRAQLLKNRVFFWYCEIFFPNTRGPLGCLLGFWRAKTCGGNNSLHFGAKICSDICPLTLGSLRSTTRRQRQRHKFCKIKEQNKSFARPPRAFFISVHFFPVLGKSAT